MMRLAYRSMTRFPRNDVFFFMCFALVFCSSCGGNGGDSENNPVGSGTNLATSLTLEGWSEFENGNWTIALDNFEKATDADADFIEAYCGLGWSWIKLRGLESAVEYLAKAVDLESISLDAYAGLAIALRDVEPADYEGAITAADTVLSQDTAYVFLHDLSFDWRDLRLILAQSQFAVGAYEEAYRQVLALGGATIDPLSHDFVELLLAEIEDLGR